MLDGLQNSHLKDAIWDLGFQIGDVQSEISAANDNIAVLSEILSGLDGTHVKDKFRDLGFEINDLRDAIKERITNCERKLEEHDNILADILSRLTHGGIWMYLFLFNLSNH
jgi:hypothetical protein